MVKRTLGDGARLTVSAAQVASIKPEAFTDKSLASIVPYRGYKTKDGDIMLGGGNDKLYGVLCDRLGHPEWKSDPRFESNNMRVKNRQELDGLIEQVTMQKTTQKWLEILEGSGMPYSAINDIQGTLNHSHGKS